MNDMNTRDKEMKGAEEDELGIDMGNPKKTFGMRIDGINKSQGPSKNPFAALFEQQHTANALGGNTEKEFQSAQQEGPLHFDSTNPLSAAQRSAPRLFSLPHPAAQQERKDTRLKRQDTTEKESSERAPTALHSFSAKMSANIPKAASTRMRISTEVLNASENTTNVPARMSIGIPKIPADIPGKERSSGTSEEEKKQCSAHDMEALNISLVEKIQEILEKFSSADLSELFLQYTNYVKEIKRQPREKPKQQKIVCAIFTFDADKNHVLKTRDGSIEATIVGGKPGVKLRDEKKEQTYVDMEEPSLIISFPPKSTDKTIVLGDRFDPKSPIFKIVFNTAEKREEFQKWYTGNRETLY